MKRKQLVIRKVKMQRDHDRIAGAYWRGQLECMGDVRAWLEERIFELENYDA